MSLSSRIRTSRIRSLLATMAVAAMVGVAAVAGPPGVASAAPANDQAELDQAVTRKAEEFSRTHGSLGRKLHASADCTLRRDGCVQRYERGLIYSSPAGLHVVRGAIGQAYAEVRWETSRLGYPTSDEDCTLKDGGCVQRFEGGLIYWTPSTGAFPVWGKIAERYASVRWETSTLGYPTSGEFCGLKDGGCFQRFQGGLMYWTPRTGAHPVWGAIRGAYDWARWETGKLGYPISGERCGLKDGGCVQEFQGGLIYWQRHAGAHPVWGAIRSTYEATGWENGKLGYPIGAENCEAGVGCHQFFTGGAIHWTPEYWSHPVWGAIGAKYDEFGGELSYALDREYCGLPQGGCVQEFGYGIIAWTPHRGAFAVTGHIADQWFEQDAMHGHLGYPIADEVEHSWGWSQKFEGGTLSERK
ncbi:hypothetical protein [Propioniferax innocua]|uniref:LGFP repeat-containing protein n=1 Tax=Propioniferax innocua TaxID=1753 RepID=A0A542ZBM2_9ACTN|nr:hypothetical protein [Propioniferax innocua]TQL57722.1 LGFP repeat-containing protein [Propioniferax innocua]